MKCNGQGFGKSGEYHYLESNHKYGYIVGFDSHIFSTYNKFLYLTTLPQWFKLIIASQACLWVVIFHMGGHMIEVVNNPKPIVSQHN